MPRGKTGKGTCSVEGCQDTAKAKGYCGMHYQRSLRGDPNRPYPRRERKPCTVEGCTNLADSKGYCGMHYMRWKKYGDPLKLSERVPAKTLSCTVEGCTKKQMGRGYCANHWKHWFLYGDPLIFKHRKFGEGTVNEQGYYLIKMPDHPNANANGYIHEQRFVMSQHLGRPLLPTENVHHKNGNRRDNRLENLELWVTCQPSGQRVEDLVAYAHEILRLYGPLVEGSE